MPEQQSQLLDPSQHNSGFICPLCSLPLKAEANSLVCDKNHRFDRAKEGYVNLLPVQKKRSRDPGDNKEMMQARRRFLEAGFYQPLSDRVNALATSLAQPVKRLLDLGCGEGYYTARLANAFREELVTDAVGIQTYGLDISRAALRVAAKQYPDIRFCVASSFDTPFNSGFFDFVLRIYAPSKSEELARIVAPGGYLLTVSAGPMHHFAVKKRIYETPRLHEDKNEWLAGFEPVHSERLQWQLELTEPEHILAFLEMTPYAWKFTPEAKIALAAKPFSCELDFRINLQRRITQNL
ncbi:23S rRNA (guanine(745)-N(1))-methyltransferase [Shewanella sp.]|uniref:23S rRNA (guanine(745)-N(1))-methyltransferase n=1 Tax=Shewanella sp. TaxID=50422 RepID=UPI003568E99D